MAIEAIRNEARLPVVPKATEAKCLRAYVRISRPEPGVVMGWRTRWDNGDKGNSTGNIQASAKSRNSQMGFKE